MDSSCFSSSGRYVEFKRFAVHDGPGIRTTLFLKGCPLSCVWCHNPETIRRMPELAFHEKKCVRCGECVRICPRHAWSNHSHRLNRSLCAGCGLCADACLYDALELFGKTITPEAAARICLEDRDFYRGNGGVTLSGGEPLLQSGFCAALLARLKAENIHCAVDTCGEVPWRCFEDVLPFTDLFLYDFKSFDSAVHRQWTGAGNERILENLKKLDRTGKAIEIRMILVPEHNLSDRNLRGAAEFFRGIGHLTGIRLLPYHSLAHAKYAAVERADRLPAVSAPEAADLERAAEILRETGVPVLLP